MAKENKGVQGETDRRLLERGLMLHHVTQKELDAYRKTLPDVSGNAEEIIEEIEERP